MAMDIAEEFKATENPDIVKYVEGNRMAREVFAVLAATSMSVAILFNEYWHSFKITGIVPEHFGF